MKSENKWNKVKSKNLKNTKEKLKTNIFRKKN